MRPAPHALNVKGLSPAAEDSVVSTGAGLPESASESTPTINTWRTKNKKEASDVLLSV